MVYEVTNTSPKRHQPGGLSRQQCSQPHRKLVGLKPVSFGFSHLNAIPQKERINLPMRTCSLLERSASGISNRSTSNLCLCAVSCVGPAHLGQLPFALCRQWEARTNGWNRVEDPAKIFNCCCLETCTGYLEDLAGGFWMHQ